MPLNSAFYEDAGDLNSGPHACTTGNLRTEPSLHPSIRTTFSKRRLGMVPPLHFCRSLYDPAQQKMSGFAHIYSTVRLTLGNIAAEGWELGFLLSFNRLSPRTFNPKEAENVKASRILTCWVQKCKQISMRSQRRQEGKWKTDISLFDGNNCNNFEDLKVSKLYLHDINPVPTSRELPFVI